MSRLYFTVETQHSDFGIKLPVFKIWTGDYTGGTYNIHGVLPSTIATMAGKPPEIPAQERFDLKFHVNKKRANASLIVNTSKQLPQMQWATDTGLSKLPLGLGTLGAALLRSNKKLPESRSSSRRSLDETRSSSKLNPKAIEARRSYDEGRYIDQKPHSRSRSSSNRRRRDDSSHSSSRYSTAEVAKPRQHHKYLDEKSRPDEPRRQRDRVTPSRRHD